MPDSLVKAANTNTMFWVHMQHSSSLPDPSYHGPIIRAEWNSSNLVRRAQAS
jgi:hypothetical protein